MAVRDGCSKDRLTSAFPLVSRQRTRHLYRYGRGTDVLSYCLIATAFGPVGLAWSEKGIARLQLPGVDSAATLKLLVRDLPDAEESHPPAMLEATVAALREILLAFFPQLAGVRVAHAWSGVLGVPRDWCATVTLDRSTGLGWAGGYVGSGVATANLAARTLRDLVQVDSGQGGRTELTELPWVGHEVRK